MYDSLNESIQSITQPLRLAEVRKAWEEVIVCVKNYCIMQKTLLWCREERQAKACLKFVRNNGDRSGSHKQSASYPIRECDSLNGTSWRCRGCWVVLKRCWNDPVAKRASAALTLTARGKEYGAGWSPVRSESATIGEFKEYFYFPPEYQKNMWCFVSFSLGAAELKVLTYFWCMIV